LFVREFLPNERLFAITTHGVDIFDFLDSDSDRQDFLVNSVQFFHVRSVQSVAVGACALRHPKVESIRARPHFICVIFVR
jgi:hypothetical protein